jgi:hypothetical protein
VQSDKCELSNVKFTNLGEARRNICCAVPFSELIFRSNIYDAMIILFRSKLDYRDLEASKSDLKIASHVSD